MGPMAVVTGKVCRECGKVRPDGQFYAMRSVCKLCVVAKATEYRRVNYAAVRARERRREATAEYRAARIVRNRELRAFMRGSVA